MFEKPIEKFSCLVMDEDKSKYDVLQMVVVPNKHSEWHAVKIAPICGKCEHISKLSIVARQLE